MQVCVESSKHQAAGAVVYTKTELTTHVPAGSQRALRQSLSQGWASSQDLGEEASQQSTMQTNAEEEEAFLEAVTRQQASARGQEPPQLLLKCRAVGAASWAGRCVLKENTSCSTGAVRLAMGACLAAAWQLLSEDAVPVTMRDGSYNFDMQRHLSITVHEAARRVCRWHESRDNPAGCFPARPHQQRPRLRC